MFDAMPGADPGKLEEFRRVLFSMRWEDPRHRRVLELEGLKAWVEPREEGYRSLHEALDGLGEP
jgi:ABC-type phosphate/phosphonate transport system substrate-binding protein